MSIAPISASPATGNTTLPGASSANAVAGKSFASLLAKESDKTQDSKNTKGKSKHAAVDSAAQAIPGQLNQQLHSDPRSWRLSLPHTRTNGNSVKQDAGDSAAVDDAEDAQEHPAAALHAGEVAFAVNFTKSAPVGVPPVHGTSGNAKAPVMPGAAQSNVSGPAQASASHNNGSQKENSGKEQHQDSSSAQPTPGTPGSAGTPTQASAQPIQSAASAMTGTGAPAAHAHLSTPMSKTSAASAAESTTEVAEPHATTPTTPQTLDFRVAGTDDREVNVRVSQRAGDVQVTVRTGDPGLAESLRSHLPELSDRLTQSGVQGEIWRPSAASSSDSGSAGDENANSGSGGDAQAFGNSSGNAGGNRNTNDQQQNAWLNELFGAQKES